MRVTPLLFLPMLLALIPLLPGCPAPSQSYPGLQPTFSSISTMVFPGCSSVSCHGGPSPQVGLDLTAANAYANLVNVPPYNAQAKADGMMRVLPGNPAKSLLVVKIDHLQNPAYGNPMPYTGVPLPDSVIATIKQWVQNGAPDN